jgi:hypothetical protein
VQKSRPILRRQRTFRARVVHPAICFIVFTALVDGSAVGAQARASLDSSASAVASVSSPATRSGHSFSAEWYRTSVFRTGCSLLIVGGVLCLLYRRSTRQPAAVEKSEIPLAAALTPAPADVDLQLLRQLGDETNKGLAREIERFLNAFDADRRLAHLVVANGDYKRVHQIGHRLLGHACAVHYEPLMELAEALQSQAALLDSAELNKLMQEFDRRFDTLRNKLAAPRASTARA